MSRHDDTITLRQMLDHIEEAIALAKDRTRLELESDRMLFLALLKLVEIVGEADFGSHASGARRDSLAGDHRYAQPSDSRL